MIRLFTSYYKDKNSERQKEIDFCLEQNTKNKYIDEIVVLTETENIKYYNNVKYISHNRPTFKDFFTFINKISDEEDINILTNSDIFLDETIKDVDKLLKNNNLLSILRWEYKNGNPKIDIMRSDCQDTWIWKGKMKKVNYDDFFMGKLGCDNRIAWEFNNIGFTLRNPATIIKTYHVHDSNVRNYKETLSSQKEHKNNKDVIPKPYYYINPF